MGFFHPLARFARRAYERVKGGMHVVGMRHTVWNTDMPVDHMNAANLPFEPTRHASDAIHELQKQGATRVGLEGRSLIDLPRDAPERKDPGWRFNQALLLRARRAHIEFEALEEEGYGNALIRLHKVVQQTVKALEHMKRMGAPMKRMGAPIDHGQMRMRLDDPVAGELFAQYLRFNPHPGLDDFQRLDAALTHERSRVMLEKAKQRGLRFMLVGYAHAKDLDYAGSAHVTYAMDRPGHHDAAAAEIAHLEHRAFFDTLRKPFETKPPA